MFSVISSQHFKFNGLSTFLKSRHEPCLIDKLCISDNNNFYSPCRTSRKTEVVKELEVEKDVGRRGRSRIGSWNVSDSLTI